jgi:hypothetical protein
MSWDHPGFEEARGRRVWLVSPAVATIIFFAAQILLAGYGDSSRSVGAAATDAPSAIPVNVRVVAQIKSADDMKPTARVPKSESELLELFNKQGGVVFSSSEVEDIATPSSEFEDQEVGVITADKQRRAARFVRP